MRVYGNKKTLSIVDSCAKANMPLLLMGETGVGKTTIVREVAKKKKKNLVRINLNGQTGREEILGKYVLEEGETKRQDGPLLIALKKGDWILLDEINAALPEVLFTLQSLIETREGKLGDINLVEKDGEIITPHKDARIFATANPADRYIGAKDFNIATLSRFVVMKVEKLSVQEELVLLADMFPKLDNSIIVKVVAIGEAINTEYQNDNISYFCSTRDIIQTLAIHKDGIDIFLSIQTAIHNKVQNFGDIEIIEKIISAILPKDMLSINNLSIDDILKILENADTVEQKLQKAKSTEEKNKKQIKKLEDELSKLNAVEGKFQEAADLFANIK